MKKMKFFGIVASAAIIVLALAACDDGGGGGSTGTRGPWTVKFFDGSTELTGLKIAGVNDNTAISLPAGPEKEGFTFDAWYRESAFTTKWNAADKVTANISLYAKYNTVGGGGDTWTVRFFDEETELTDL
ncbi:MAG: InlB B-repeat-containing protein, partial [Treponema sp.]|nr:InlB B-repeat-containing protein [Treponema sp.]